MEWEAAAREYTSAVNLSKLPSFERQDLAAVYLSNRAACYIRLERFEEAVDDCEAALARNAKFWKAGARAGKALIMLGEFERALAHLEGAEHVANAKFQETPTARRMAEEVRKVRQLLEGGDSERALSCIKSIVVETPNAFPLQLLHLQTLAACGRFDEVLPLCQELRGASSRALTPAVAADLQHMNALALVGLARLPQAVQVLRELIRDDPDNKKYQVDFKRVKGMHQKMVAGMDALESHRFAEARACFTDALALDEGNQRFAAVMLSLRASAFQKQREEFVDSTDAVERARKEVEEANAELEKAQRRLVKGNERLQLFTRREVQVRAQFEQDAEVCAQEPAPDPTPPHVQEKELVGKWAVHKAIDDACQALDHDSTCAAALIHRARAYVLVGDLGEAVADFERALASEELKRTQSIGGVSQRTIQSELRDTQRKLQQEPLDHYRLLGLSPGPASTANISADDIKKAYRRMAMKFHPDKQAHLGLEARERMERRFKLISEVSVRLPPVCLCLSEWMFCLWFGVWMRVDDLQMRVQWVRACA